MDRKKKRLLILPCVIAAVLLLRFVWIHAPSGGMVILKVEDAGLDIEEPLTREEVTAVKKILWGKIRWPESLYGVPACGFGKDCAIILDGTRYMIAWDSCGTLCVEDEASDKGSCAYINISDAERTVIDEIFDARRAG